jgi:DNA-binding CsgD family transcriptional regulator
MKSLLKEECSMRTDLLERKNDILQWITEGKSKAFMAKELGCNPKTINPLLERLGITYEGNQSGKG